MRYRWSDMVYAWSDMVYIWFDIIYTCSDMVYKGYDISKQNLSNRGTFYKITKEELLNPAGKISTKLFF